MRSTKKNVKVRIRKIKTKKRVKTKTIKIRRTRDIIKEIWRFLINHQDKDFETSELANELKTYIIDAYTNLDEYLERLEEIGVLEKNSDGKWEVKNNIDKFEFVISP